MVTGFRGQQYNFNTLLLQEGGSVAARATSHFTRRESPGVQEGGLPVRLTLPNASNSTWLYPSSVPVANARSISET